jgi:hypothetical protein
MQLVLELGINVSQKLRPVAYQAGEPCFVYHDPAVLLGS